MYVADCPPAGTLALSVGRDGLKRHLFVGLQPVASGLQFLSPAALDLQLADCRLREAYHPSEFHVTTF